MTTQYSRDDELEAGEVERLEWLLAELDQRHGIRLKAAPASKRALLDAAQTMYAGVQHLDAKYGRWTDDD